MKNPFAFPYADWVPIRVRRILFYFAPGKWTLAEIESINERARKHKEAMDELTD